MSPRPKPLVLLIIDGFGIAPDDAGNAITQAKTPTLRDLISKYPTMTLRANGEAVGLSWGEMGNSEVGHLAIGAGRVYYQSLPRISLAIENGSFFDNEVLKDAAEHLKKTGGALHLIGMIGIGKVHASDQHGFALLEFAKKNGIGDVFLHAILDGRDSLYNSGHGFLEKWLEKMRELGIGAVASVSGRYYAMDRDNKWERTEKAYRAIAEGKGEPVENPLDAIQSSYAKEVYDEQFVPTTAIKDGVPVAKIEEGDVTLFFNFRPDRSRQLTKAFTLPTFEYFDREYIKNLFFATMTEYEAGLPVHTMFPPEVIHKGFAEIISNIGLKQLHIAETEKYAHVTFFLNGTREEPFPGEERVMIQSPKVSSYDETPEMGTNEIADRVAKEIKLGNYDVIVANFANPDMVGHTGNFEATKTAVENVDSAIKRVTDAALQTGGVVVITSDHGNAEEMKNLKTGEMDKEHSTNPVPFIIVGKEYKGKTSVAGEIPGGDLSLIQPVGVLADVAPTLLTILGIPQPPDMTGQPLT